jgi:hypothetical protein
MRCLNYAKPVRSQTRKSSLHNLRVSQNFSARTKELHPGEVIALKGNTRGR